MATRCLHATFLGLVLACAGCASVGPDFQAPAAAAAAPATWAQRPSSAPELAAEAGADESALAARWWSAFGDATLDALQARLASANPDVLTAALRYAQARAQQAVTAAQAGPHVDAKALAQRQRASEHGPETRLVDAIGGANRERLVDVLASPYPLFQAGFDASWELDLWGRVRRSVEAADARAEGAGFELAQLRLALSAELARAYWQLRQAQQQQALLLRQQRVAADLLMLLQARAAQGLIADDEVLAQQVRVADLAARTAPLRAREAAAANQLGLLLGATPGALNTLLAAPAATAPQVDVHADAQADAHADAAPPLPPLALGLPAELARRRPDIRAAEAQLHAATADIGVAVADLYPRLTLGASAGLQSIDAGRFGDWGARTWQVGPVLSLPLFDHGRRRATIELRQLAQQQAAVAYQKAVLQAWQDIDDALTGYAAEQRRQRQLRLRLDGLGQSWQLAQARRAHGLSDDAPPLQAEAQWLQARADVVDSDAQLRIGWVAIAKAVAGGVAGGVEGSEAQPAP